MANTVTLGASHLKISHIASPQAKSSVIESHKPSVVRAHGERTRAVSEFRFPSQSPSLQISHNENRSSIVRSYPRLSTRVAVERNGSVMTTAERVGSFSQGEAESSGRVRMERSSKKEVVMVDPIEAKRLAAAEMVAIQTRAKLKRRTEIEVINGGWALLGLTVGIVIEGYTGKPILVQIGGYLDKVADFLSSIGNSLSS